MMRLGRGLGYIAVYLALALLVAGGVALAAYASLQVGAINTANAIALARCQDALDRGRQAENAIITATVAARQESLNDAGLAYNMAHKDIDTYCQRRVTRIWPPATEPLPLPVPPTDAPVWR